MGLIELKPCPFCGGVARITTNVTYNGAIRACCTKCHASGDLVKLSAEYAAADIAAAEWNQRTDQPPKARWTREDVTTYDGEKIKNGAVVCGRCKKAFFMPTDTFDYCPNCGAKMEGVEKE